MLVLSCTSSAITAEWTDVQSQVLGWTGITPSISVDMQHFMLVGNLAHCVWKGWNCLDLTSFLIWYRSKKFLRCATRKSSTPHIVPFPPLFQHWWKLSSSSVICSVCFLYGISALQENQIWQSRLIMMQIQNVGCWWACCHRCLPQSCFFLVQYFACRKFSRGFVLDLCLLWLNWQERNNTALCGFRVLLPTSFLKSVYQAKMMLV